MGGWQRIVLDVVAIFGTSKCGLFGWFVVFMEYLRQFLSNYDESRTIGFALKMRIQGYKNMQGKSEIRRFI